MEHPTGYLIKAQTKTHPQGLKKLAQLSLLTLAITLQNCCSPKPQPTESTAGLTTSSTQDQKPQSQESLAMSQNPASRQLLVAFQEIPDEPKRALLWKKYELREVEQVSAQSLFLVEAPPGTTSEALKKIQNALTKETGVRYAEPNIQMRIFKSQ